MDIVEIKEWKRKSDFEKEHSETTSNVIDWLIAEVERLESELVEANEEITHLNQMSFGI